MYTDGVQMGIRITLKQCPTQYWISFPYVDFVTCYTALLFPKQFVTLKPMNFLVFSSYY